MRMPLPMIFLSISIFVFTALLAVCYLLGSQLVAAARAQVPVPHGFKPETLKISSESGKFLAAWLLEGDPAKGAVLLLHGIRANRSVLVERARFLHAAGYTVLMIDFQAHGESEGHRITLGYLESLDARSALNYLHQRYPKKSLAVIGVSLGGAAALLGIEPKSLDALIIESAYAHIFTAIRNRLELRFGRWGAWLLPIFTLQIHFRLGIDPELLNTGGKIKNFSCPLLVIGGGLDQRTKPKDSMDLFQAAPQGRKQFWLIPDAKHEDFHLHQKQRYEQKVLQFFKHNLKNHDEKIAALSSEKIPRKQILPQVN